MTFPATALSQGVEVYASGVWTDITSDVYSRDGISISRGRSDESSQAEPATMTLTLDNRTDAYSPRNPTSAYYGTLGRNAKVRHWVKNGSSRLRLDSGQDWRTSDSAPLSITGDIDLRVDCSLPSWRPGTVTYLGGPFKSNAYGMSLTSAGMLVMHWYSGTVHKTATSVMPVPGATTGRNSVRVTLDVDNGSSGWTARFYYSDTRDMGGTWTLYDTVSGSGTTSIDDTGHPVLSYATASAEVFELRIYADLIGTDKRASPNFASKSSGTTSFADAEGNTWSDSTTTGAVLDNKHYRFHGDISAWDAQQDPSGLDRWTRIDCSGLTRRIARRATPSRSAMRRGIPGAVPGLIAYWPLEDATGASSLECVLGGAGPGRVVGAVELGSYSDMIASSPVATIKTGRIHLPLAPYTAALEFQVGFICSIPEGNSIPTDSILARVLTTSTMRWVDVIYSTGDVITMKAYNYAGELMATSSGIDITPCINGRDTRFSISLAQDGADVDIGIYVLPLGESLGYADTMTAVAGTLGNCAAVSINPTGVDLEDTSVGHVAVSNDIVDPRLSVRSLEQAYAGEAAHTRISRLCLEEGVTPFLRGAADGAVAMGRQSVDPIISLIRQAAEVDGGVLTEARDAYGLMYRTRESIINQPPSVEIIWDDCYLQSLNPTVDDQRTLNRSEVQRAGGTTSTVTDTTSSMSTQDPPLGVGLYDSSATLSLYSDEQARQEAAWQVCLGTVDEHRISEISVNLAHPDICGDPDLAYQLLHLDVGDRILISNLPTWVQPDSCDQIIQGISETISQFEHTITLSTVPASPYRAMIYDSDTTWPARWSNQNTVTTEALDTSETEISVSMPYGPDWILGEGETYDIMIGGERMTLTGIAGAGGAHVFTVTRSMNGVVKSHAMSEKVTLADPVRYALGESGDGIATMRGLMYALDYALPEVTTDTGNGENAIVSTSFTPLPTYPCKALIYNPHPTAAMLCYVGFGAWLAGDAYSEVRMALYVRRSGMMHIEAGVGVGTSIGWGEVPATAVNGILQHAHTTITVSLDPSPFPYEIEIYARKEVGEASVSVKYPTLRIIPLRYEANT